MSKQRKIISVGGSIIIPHTGFDVAFLKKFKKLILKHVEAGQKFILIIGGGGTCRKYQQAAKAVDKSLTDTDLDWIGIHTTIYNAQFVKYLFKDYAYDKIITDPREKVKTSKPIILAAGWKPGCSTDHDAVMLAETYSVKDMMNLSNIEYVYDKDPNKYKNAKRVDSIDWASFRRDIVGYDWVPGKNAPFDPIASKLAEKLGLTVSVLDGKNLKEVDKVLRGESFKGTIVHP